MDLVESSCPSDFNSMESEFEDRIDEQPSGSASDCLDEHMETLVTGCEKDAADGSPTPPPEGSVDDKSGFLGVQGGLRFSNHEENESFLALSGVKRQRLSVDEKQPSVHVIYNSLPRDSIKKLRELLQQWSQWHSQKYPPSDEVNLLLESGEETHYPALCVGMDKPCAVAFWVDDKVETNDLMPLDAGSVPLYDRGYSSALTSTDGSGSLDGGLQNLDRFRCFNCGSYSHALKDCPRPRDNMAVNNARKVHKSKRSQNRSSVNSTRYYQNSHKGKYDGLSPGTLDAETRKALGLGALDPPPWLNRMREIGYPPGYLDQDEEDQPSGITIFDDEKDSEETEEEGEILNESTPKPSKKMMVEFPGVNVPIPEDADQRLWAPNSHRRNDNSNESSHSRRSYSESSWHSDMANHHQELRSRWESDYDRSSSGNLHRRSRFSRWRSDLDEELPPGCDPGMSPSLSTRYPRWDDHSSGY